MTENAAQNRWHDALDENPKFHLAVASAAENAMIEHIQRLLNEASDQATRSLRPAATPDRVHKVIREHQEICDAIRAGDAARAQRGGFEHLITSWMAEWSRKPDARG